MVKSLNVFNPFNFVVQVFFFKQLTQFLIS